MSQSNAAQVLHPNEQVLMLQSQPNAVLFTVQLQQPQQGTPVALGYTSQGQHQLKPQFTDVSLRRQYGIPNKICGFALSIIMIVLGSIAIVLNTVSVVLNLGFYYCGHGFWGGIFFILAGAFGLGAYYSKTKCKISAFIVLSIIAAIVTSVMFSCEIVGILDAWWTGDLVVESLLLIVTFIGFIMALILSSFGCAAMCCSDCCRCCKGTMIVPVVRPDNETVSVIVNGDESEPQQNKQNQPKTGPSYTTE